MNTAPQGAPVAPPAPPAHDTSDLWLVSSVAALGGLLFGNDRVVIGGAQPFFERHFHRTNPAL